LELHTQSKGRDLLEGEDIGAEARPLALVALDGLGDGGDLDPAGEHDVLNLIAAEVNEARVGVHEPALAVLEADVRDNVVAAADGRYGRLRGALSRGLKRHYRPSDSGETLRGMLPTLRLPRS